jgi:hypothetical protein
VVSAEWLRRLLIDLRDPTLSDEGIGEHYGLTGTCVRQIRLDNNIARQHGIGLVGGRWINVRGVQRWMHGYQDVVA